MIDPDLVPVVAARFRALGDPARLSLLAALHEGERTVGDLVEATGRAQPNVSQHLASLAKAGLVAPRREGQHVYYRIADPHLSRICDAVCASLAAKARQDEKWVARLPRTAATGRGRR